MAFTYRPPVNYRGAAVHISAPESFTIEGGVALLSEAPADPTDGTTPVIVTVGGNPRTRVTTAPGAGEFRVMTQTVIGANGQPYVEHLPLLQFNAADEGLSGTADYYQTGTVFTAEWFASLIAFLTPLIGASTVGDLPTPTMDLTRRGRRGDLAILSDSSMYYSDGSAWNYISGQVQGTVAGATTLAAAMQMAFDASWATSGDLVLALVGGMTSDAVQAEVAAAVMAHVGTVDGNATYDGPLAWDDSTTLTAALATTMDAIQAEIAALTLDHVGVITGNAIQAEVGAMAMAHVGAVGGDGDWQGEVALNLIDDYAINSIASYYTNAHVGDYVVQNGRLESNVTANYEQNIGDTFILNGASFTDGSVEVKMCRTNNVVHPEVVAMGLIARWASVGASGIYVYIDATGLHGVSYLYGTPTAIGTDYLFTPAADTVYTVRIQLSGSSCTISLDGTTRITGTVTHTGAGQFGFYCGRNTWDNGGIATTPTGLVYFDDLKSSETVPTPTLIDAFATNTIASYTLSGDSPTAWSVTGGRLRENGVDQETTFSVRTCIRTGSSLGDGSVEGKLRFGTNGDGANRISVLLARFGDASNYLQAFIDGSAGLKLEQIVAGVTTQIGATYTFTPSVEVDYTIRITMSSGAVAVSLNGVQRITGTTTRTAAGSYGFRTVRIGWYDEGQEAWHTADGLMEFDDLQAG